MAAERMWTSADQSAASHDDTDTGIVHRAAAVLDEELAAAALRSRAAAPPTEEHTGDTQPPAALVPALNLFRQRLLQWLGELPAIVEGARARDDQEPPTATASGARPVLEVNQRAHAGDIAELRIGLMNESQTEVMDVELCWTDLVTGPTDRIAASRVTLQPDRVRLEPERDTEVVVQVHLPPDAPVGTYTGLVRATRPADQMVIITIHVA